MDRPSYPRNGYVSTVTVYECADCSGYSALCFTETSQSFKKNELYLFPVTDYNGNDLAGQKRIFSCFCRDQSGFSGLNGSYKIIYEETI